MRKNKYWLRFDGLNIMSRITATAQADRDAREDGFTEVAKQDFNRIVELVKSYCD